MNRSEEEDLRARIERYRQEMMKNYRLDAPVTPPENEPPASPPAPGDGETFTGYLTVTVFSGQRAEPIAGAQVTVTRPSEEGELLMGSAVTDRDGRTPVFALPALDPELTFDPETTHPYIGYNVRISADGYATALHENVPVYGSNHVTQPAGLLPLLPGESPDIPRVYRSGGPADL